MRAASSFSSHQYFVCIALFKRHSYKLCLDENTHTYPSIQTWFSVNCALVARKLPQFTIIAWEMPTCLQTLGNRSLCGSETVKSATKNWKWQKFAFKVKVLPFESCWCLSFATTWLVVSISERSMLHHS